MTQEIFDPQSINLNRQSNEILARWWNEFNVWKWPGDLADLKPADYDSWDIDRMSKFIRPFMHAIFDRVGEQPILRWHHVHVLQWTSEQSKIWIREHLLPKPPAKPSSDFERGARYMRDRAELALLQMRDNPVNPSVAREILDLAAQEIHKLPVPESK